MKKLELVDLNLTSQDSPIINPETTQNNTYRYIGRREVRQSTGRVWPDIAYEERRRQVLSTPLP